MNPLLVAVSSKLCQVDSNSAAFGLLFCSLENTISGPFTVHTESVAAAAGKRSKTCECAQLSGPLSHSLYLRLVPYCVCAN